MNALQLHYTSCRRGLSGSAGFQTRTLTPGITSDEQREIEQRSVYRPPRDANPEPGAEEIARDFPLALRFYRLGSGRQALTMSRYTGRDYSGRWGNFFAHTLVFEGSSAPPLWPIDYFEWPYWQGGLAPAQDTEEEPPPLPVVDLGEIVPAESFRFEEIQQFLGEEHGRTELLTRMGRAVMLGRETSRAVVIRDTATNNLFWIACIQKLFPPQHAATLSYSTYQDDPRDGAAVNATTGGTGFTFSDVERNFQYYMFDLTTGRHSEVPVVENDYPALAVHWLAKTPREIDRFCEFMDFFNHREVEPGLIWALDLFELSRGRANQVGGEQLAAMICFADRWATPEGKVELMEVLAQTVAQSGLEQAADYGGVIRFLADGAEITGQPHHREMAFASWLRLLDEQLVDRGVGLETARETWAHLQRTHGAYTGELADRLLLPSRWKSWQSRLPGLPSEIPLFLVEITWRCLELMRRLPAWQQPEVAILIQTLVGVSGNLEQVAQAVLETVPRDADAIAAVSRLLAETGMSGEPQVNRRAVGRALGRILARAPADLGKAVRRQLDSDKAWDLLFGEWLAICQEAEAPEAVFPHYRQTVLAALPGYSQHCRSWVLSSLLDQLPDGKRVQLALEWLREGEVTNFPEDLARQCLELTSRALPLDPRSRGSDDVARLVAEEATRRGMVLRPDRIRLRRALALIGRVRSLPELQLTEIAQALEGLDALSYVTLLEGFLVPALGLSGNLKEHRQVLRAVFRSEHRAAFEKAYCQFFRAGRKGRWSEPLQGALKFWLTFGSDGETDGSLAAIEKTAFEELARALSHLPTSRYHEIGKSLRALRPRETTRWQRIETVVAQRQRGLLGKVRDFLFGRARV